jgi:hypothetical protein
MTEDYYITIAQMDEIIRYAKQENEFDMIKLIKKIKKEQRLK